MAEEHAIRCTCDKLLAEYDERGLRFLCRGCRTERLLLWSDLERARQEPDLILLVCGDITLVRKTSN